jgi:hypothetical protein
MRHRPRPARRVHLALAAGVTTLLVACGPVASPSLTSISSPTPDPGQPLTTAQLKYAIVDRFGPLWYCDRDLYPVPVDDEQVLAIERFGEVQADVESFAAIIERLAPGGAGDTFTDDQKLAIYRAWKVLQAIGLEPAGDDGLRFDYLAQPPAGGAEGTRTTGVIDTTGHIEIELQAAAGEPMCPICLVRGTLIETPAGQVRVEQLRPGDPAWTLDAAGRRVHGTVVAIGSSPAPAGHQVVRLVLADGRSATASPGHPLADGRRLGDLVPGDRVQGAVVVSVERLRYADAKTYDVVLSGTTGAYLVDGIELGSTLRP